MGRILAISDIHGMYDEFIQLLEKVKYDPKLDELVLLGDYVDRGPEPVKCIKKVMELEALGATVLMGNHEEMCLDIEYDINRGKIKIENLDYIDCTQRTLSKIYFNAEAGEILKYIKNLKKIHRIREYVFVHAGYNPYLHFNEQTDYTLLWSREENFNKPIPNDMRIVFGHTPTKYLGCPDTIYQKANKIGIDCGAVFGGNLACLIIQDRSINAKYIKCERQKI